jgi:hypothetical protein
MDSSVIYESIYQHFLNYEYKLFNSFVYDWECDFFGMSKSGYFMEVEVKVSRSDYFNDFKKEKHELFKDFFAKKSHHIYRGIYQMWSRDRLICEYIEPKINFEYDGKDCSNRIKRLYNWRRGNHNGRFGYWVNDYGGSWVGYGKKEVYAPSTGISIKPLSEIHCPNTLYFACPENMVKIDEVPAYAGLLYIRDAYTCDVIKKAPYIHKTKQDLTKILLKKFYNLWQFKTARDEKLETLNQQQKQK